MIHFEQLMLSQIEVLQFYHTIHPDSSSQTIKAISKTLSILSIILMVSDADKSKEQKINLRKKFL